jgi:hypothetical protein
MIMKTRLLLLSLFTAVFAMPTQAQDRTTINAKNTEISDNLDLRAVASIFGDSQNLQEFERKLNDPKLQISNLDLNDDDEVDYLRVIESVEKRTHVIIIQAVLDRDVYQDVATIDVEKDGNNNVQVQIVGDVYMYGQNYIYEPEYHSIPLIYASFWVSNYRPYYSTWNWNYYPSYYHAWNPFPVFRYRNNINISLNINNRYNYVTSRRSHQAVILHHSRRSNAYERQYPNNSFSRRNTQLSNRYELDQRRDTRSTNSRDRNGYNQNRMGSARETTYNRSESQRGNNNRVNSTRETTPQRTESQRGNNQNRVNSTRETISQRTESQRGNSENRVNPSRESAPQRPSSQREFAQNRVNPTREAAPQRTSSQREFSQNRANSSRESAPQRTDSQRDFSQNRANSSRESAPQRTESQRDFSQNRANSSRESAPQRTEAQRGNSQNRVNSSRESSPQRTESQRGDNASSRNNNRRS